MSMTLPPYHDWRNDAVDCDVVAATHTYCERCETAAEIRALIVLVNDLIVEIDFDEDYGHREPLYRALDEAFRAAARRFPECVETVRYVRHEDAPHAPWTFSKTISCRNAAGEALQVSSIHTFSKVFSLRDGDPFRLFHVSGHTSIPFAA
ncbi:MAG: hypothetical protein QM811_04830 [Pirellulales bacterium]